MAYKKILELPVIMKFKKRYRQINIPPQNTHTHTHTHTHTRTNIYTYIKVKVKLLLCLTKHHVMKTYLGVAV
jgi:hypothetical protein